VQAEGWTNSVFSGGEVGTVSIDGVFDAVMGRVVLPFIANHELGASDNLYPAPWRGGWGHVVNRGLQCGWNDGSVRLDPGYAAASQPGQLL
jgi:hypothetical protein